MPRHGPLPTAPASLWNDLFGVLACLVVAIFPLLPDEKLNRLKLLSLQLGVAALVAAVGARALSAGGLLRDAPTQTPIKPRWSLWVAPPVAVALWLLINLFLTLVAADRALAVSELGRVTLAAAAFASFRFARLDERWTTRVLFSWTAAALLVAVYATLQQKGGLGPIIVPKMSRVTGTFGNPIFLSSYLILSLFVATSARRMTQRDSE